MKTKFKLMLFAVNVFSLIITAQIQTSGNLRTHINTIISSMPTAVGGNQYQTPTPAELTTWGNIIDDIISGNYSDAHANALTIGYQLLEYSDSESNSVFYVLENTLSNYWGTFIYAPTPLRNRLFIQAPHPIKDFNTGKQGYHVFLSTGAKAFLLSGTSRCNSSSFSSCDGQTSICSDSDALENYRVSDQAHVIESTFQRTTERFEALVLNMIYIQLHGFTKEESDPYVIMGNGINNSAPPSGFQYLESLSTNLFNEDNTLTFKIAHVDNWTRLTGTTNTQGRFVNGSTVTPCSTSAITNTGRFLHLEQEKDKLRADNAGWTKMANAIATTFQDLLPIELLSFTATHKDGNIILNWETATEINNYGFEIQRKIVGDQLSDWKIIGFVEGKGNSNSPKEYSFTDQVLNLTLDHNIALNPTFSYRLKQIDFDGKVEYSAIIEINANILPNEFELFQNYPNPFNPITTIQFGLPKESHVNLEVFNILGEKITEIVNKEMSAGYHKINFNGANLNSGIYFYRIKTGDFIKTRKFTLLK